MTTQANFQNRTLFHGDNLDFLKAINSETVDLIATDPPFNKGRDFHATPESLAQGASFQDRWSWEQDVHDEWLERLEGNNERIWSIIDTAKLTYGHDIAAYIAFMAVRLLECKRVLKPTGSIYLHCDPTASHYIKVLMDAVFGRENFRNEIVWAYRTGGAGKTSFSKKHDIILFYSKSEKTTFNQLKEKAYTKSKNRKAGVINYGKGNAEFFQDEEGVYNMVGMRDVWEVSYINSLSPERTGHATQKPIALYERIIAASSNKGDVVLDPFAGSATTLIAAEKLDRQWIGMDIWNQALDVVIGRLEEIGLKGPNGLTSKLKISQTQFLYGEVFYQTTPPHRTDPDQTEEVEYLATINRRHDPQQDGMNDHQRKQLLIQHQGPVCQGCGITCAGKESRRLQIDHVKPKAKGGSDYIHNRALLCGECNREKSDKPIDINEFREHTKALGFYYWNEEPEPWKPIKKAELKQAQLQTTRALS